MKAVYKGAWAPIFSIFAVFLVTPAGAVVTSTLTVDSYEDWNKGEAETAFISSLGEVKAGWASKRIALELDGAWSALRSRDGSILVGTANGGAIYRVRGDKVAKLAAIPDVVAVVSLAQGKNGTIYAGTMPGGQIWQIAPKTGRASKLVSLAGVETVWALALNRAGNTLYAGTGPQGKLFAVTLKSRQAKVVFESDDKRIMAVTATSDGGIWLGTSDKAQVFRYDPKRGTTRAMADFSGNEVTAMAAADGGIVVVANDFAEPSSSGFKTRAAVDKANSKPRAGQAPDMPDQGSAPGADKPSPAGSEPVRKGARKGKGALYRIDSNGGLRQLHALTATYFTDVVVTKDGRIFAGAGDKGRIYLIDTNDSVATAFDVEERIIAKILYDPKRGLAFTTSDASALYRAAGKAKSATYLSRVFDTEAQSRFGKILWHGSGQLKIETRTGNTAEPGKGWSTFQAPKDVARSGGNSRSGHISSPTGRYLQFRVSFTGGDDAVLRTARIYYLPHNQPTRIAEVTVSSADTRSGITLKEGAAEPRSPVLKVSWDIENPDGDTMEYKLEVRREGEALWRSLRQKPVTSTSYRWNTEMVPNGYYRLRVIASDRRSNSADRSREHEKTSNLFLVDNEKPRLEAVKVKYPQASARAVDAMSAIAEMAYSIDDGPWLVGATADGLFDSLAENLRLRLPSDLKSGVHTLAIRVADEAGNIGSTSTTFRVK